MCSSSAIAQRTSCHSGRGVLVRGRSLARRGTEATVEASGTAGPRLRRSSWSVATSSAGEKLGRPAQHVILRGTALSPAARQLMVGAHRKHGALNLDVALLFGDCCLAQLSQ